MQLVRVVRTRNHEAWQERINEYTVDGYTLHSTHVVGVGSIIEYVAVLTTNFEDKP